MIYYLCYELKIFVLFMVAQAFLPVDDYINERMFAFPINIFLQF